MLLLCSVFNSFSEDVDMDRVHKGEAVLRSTLDFIEKNDFTDSSIRKLTGNVNENSIQLGFGLQQYCDGISGGGVSVNINYVVFKEQLIKMSIEIYGYDNIKNHIGADLQERYSKIFSRYGGYKYRYENDLNYEKYNDYKKEIVGECEAAVIPQEYKKYYDCLYKVYDDCEPRETAKADKEEAIMTNTISVNHNMIISGGKTWKINWQKISAAIGKIWASVRNSLQRGSESRWVPSRNGSEELLNQISCMSCRLPNYFMYRSML